MEQPQAANQNTNKPNLSQTASMPQTPQTGQTVQPAAQQPMPVKKSIWKKWWFWLIIILAIVILGAGVWFLFF